MKGKTNGMGRRELLTWLLLFAALLLFPVVVRTTYYVHTAIVILMWVVIAHSWNLLGGYTGQVSFGHAAFFGAGAYVTGMASMHWGISPWWGFLLSIPVAVALALFVGWVCFRLSGPYFALAVLALAEILRVITNNLKPLTGGAEGILIIPTFRSKVPYYYAILLLAALLTFLIYRLMRSKLGFYFLAVREDQDAAEAIGVDTLRYKMISLIISAVFTSFAGVFYMNFMGYIEPQIVFNIVDISIAAILVVMLGGTATLAGPVVGAVLYVALEEVFRRFVGDGYLVLFGLMIIAIIIFLPNGIVGEWEKIRGWFGAGRRPARPVERGAA